MSMRIGLSAYDISGTELVSWPAAADEAGFESLWLGEHIVLPSDYGSEHPTTGDTAHQHHTGPIVDPVDQTARPARRPRRVRQRHHPPAVGDRDLHPAPPSPAAHRPHDPHPAGRRRRPLPASASAPGGWRRSSTRSACPSTTVPPGWTRRWRSCVRAWSGDTFSHEGPLFAFGNVQLSPEPVDVPLILGGQHRAGAAPVRHRRRWLVQLRDARRSRTPSGSATESSNCATPPASTVSSPSTCAPPTPIRPTSPGTRPRASSTCSSGPTSCGRATAMWPRSGRRSLPRPPTSASNDTERRRRTAASPNPRAASRRVARQLVPDSRRRRLVRP